MVYEALIISIKLGTTKRKNEGTELNEIKKCLKNE